MERTIMHKLVEWRDFCEEAPQYYVAVAGSTLDISLHRGESFPVGKVDIIEIDVANQHCHLSVVPIGTSAMPPTNMPSIGCAYGDVSLTSGLCVSPCLKAGASPALVVTARLRA